MAANSTQRPFCVGFAAETQQVSEFGQAKRIAKNVPLLIANHGPDTFGQDHNQVSLIDANGVYPLQQMDKLNLAREIIAQVVQRLPA
jgi:phosphopantothenoylcysteine decarboxylase/phosphopantothenate--cysteine ligase